MIVMTAKKPGESTHLKGQIGAAGPLLTVGPIRIGAELKTELHSIHQ